MHKRETWALLQHCVAQIAPALVFLQLPQRSDASSIAQDVGKFLRTFAPLSSNSTLMWLLDATS
eukprot:2142579-Amphidinium_carterae.1